MSVPRGAAPLFPIPAAVLAAALLLAPDAHAVEWRVLDASAADSVAALSVRDFAATVTRATGGTLGAAFAAGTAAAVVDAVASGRAALGVFPLAQLEGADPVLGMDRVPFLATNFVDARKLWQVLRPRVEQALAARGMTLLYAVASPPPAPLSRRALADLDAWRGARLLVDAPALGVAARLLGAPPVSGASPRALLGGGKADMVFESADAAVRDKAWEYATHYLHAPAWFPKQVIAANKQALAALDAKQRDALLSAADRAATEGWSRSEQATDDAVQKLRDYAIKTATTPVNTLIRLEALGRELLFAWSETAGEAGAELVEGYYAIR